MVLLQWLRLLLDKWLGIATFFSADTYIPKPLRGIHDWQDMKGSRTCVQCRADIKDRGFSREVLSGPEVAVLCVTSFYVAKGTVWNDFIVEGL